MQRSLFDYLTSPNPVLDNRHCPRGPNSRTSKAVWRFPRVIEPWKDFNLASLTSIYGGIFQNVVHQHFDLIDFSRIPEFPFCQVADEDSLEALLIKWNQSVVSEALLASQDKLGDAWPPPNILMARGGQANYPGSNSAYRPDWGGLQLTVAQEEKGLKSPNLLPGDTKLSSKWTSRELADIDKESEDESKKPRSINIQKVMGTDWARPIRQVFTYCLVANVRYGFIITDRELVVLRISAVDQNSAEATDESQGSLDSAPDATPTKSPKAGKMQYKVIPWSTENANMGRAPGKLTINLALWWLHMLAAENSKIHRLYTPLSEMVLETDSVPVPPVQETPKTPEPTLKRSLTSVDTPRTSLKRKGDHGDGNNVAKNRRKPQGRKKLPDRSRK